MSKTDEFIIEEFVFTEPAAAPAFCDPEAPAVIPVFVCWTFGYAAALGRWAAAWFSRLAWALRCAALRAAARLFLL